ncbi:hypothetical protein E2C01_022346 [Portunus trituberculatus]|uniref:Uncharacterized protein n=1 Tax=Portunus trituberculatus TaxID=210409 RepID=A0A5B7E7E5_PORTR|nr:hypothetical protein [Portunus trituberculatus]
MFLPLREAPEYSILDVQSDLYLLSLPSPAVVQVLALGRLHYFLQGPETGSGPLLTLGKLVSTTQRQWDGVVRYMLSVTGLSDTEREVMSYEVFRCTSRVWCTIWDCEFSVKFKTASSSVVFTALVSHPCCGGQTRYPGAVPSTCQCHDSLPFPRFPKTPVYRQTRQEGTNKIDCFTQQYQ